MSEARAGPGATAFMFTGQGAQYAGMGAQLYEAFDVFRDTVDEVCAYFDPSPERSLSAVMFATEDPVAAHLLDRTEFTQPALFCLEVALYRLLWSRRLRADYLIGHSIGELTAAFCAGVFSLEHACALVEARARLMGALPAGGAMLAVKAGVSEVEAVLKGHRSVGVAAVNAPGAVVVSGGEQDICEIERQLADNGRRTRRLRVSHAFHSPLMEPMLAEFEATAALLDYRQPTLPIVSTLTGAVAGEELATPRYWVRQARGTVQFAAGVATLARVGVCRYVELGPDGVLCRLAERCLSDVQSRSPLICSTLRRRRDELQTLNSSLNFSCPRS